MITLSNGIQMSVMAIGTNWMRYKELKPVLKAGLKAGFRAIDTASDYGNEHIVGRALKNVLNELGISRSDIFITTKIGNSRQKEGNIYEQLEISLNNLNTDYLDLWLMHWPYPGYYINTWKKMEYLYRESGKVRAIGVANYGVRHFKELFSADIAVKPMVNQIEYHPLRTAPDLISFMETNDIKIQAYAPLCRMVPSLKDSEFLKSLSQKYHKSLGQIILRWHTQQENVIPVFKSYKPYRFAENINIFDFRLTDQEMDGIFAMNQNYKYHLESASCPGY